MSLDYFLDNPDYTIRWPPELFAREIRRLLGRAYQFGRTREWNGEIDHLLREAFTSPAMAEDFGGLLTNEHVAARLTELANNALHLQREASRPPYFSQKRSAVAEAEAASRTAVVFRVRRLIQEFLDQHYFAQEIGFGCFDGHGDFGKSPAEQLSDRVGKPWLWVDDLIDWERDDHVSLGPSSWTDDDVCDFIEVFHDLAARPTRGWEHGFNNCGWHPEAYSRPSGQALYRWRINELLEEAQFAYRLATSGDDAGRMVRSTPDGFDDVVTEVLDSESSHRDQVAHAIALFRKRDGTPEDRRSAVVSLCGVLEANRNFAKSAIRNKDDGALFEIANNFHLRHQDKSQYRDYAPAYLEWIFYWYLATVRLIDQLLAQADDEG